MNIPDKAVEAGARAEWAKYLERTPERQEPHDWESLEPNERCDVREYILPILEAAAPFIAAQALRDEAERIEALEKDSGPERLRAHLRARSLRHTATKLDPL